MPPALLTAALAFAVTLPLAVGGTRLVLAWLRHKQILDHPNERSSHSLPTPRGGGLAVTPAVLLAWGGLALAGGTESGGTALPGLAAVMAGALGLLALSWLDDRRGLPAGLRFLCQIAAAGLGLALLPTDRSVFQGFLPFWADRGLALLAWVWFTNLYNFMDGIDGITGVETGCIGLGLALLPLAAAGAPVPPALAVVPVAAALGFLVWNWHPARIFLGDSGSVPLGYLLGWLLLSTAAAGHPAAALILPLYYLADATFTLGRRAARGEKVWQAHRQHFYQKAVRGGCRHDAVVRLILAADLGLVVLALLAESHPWPALAAAGLLVAALLARLAWLGRGARP